LGAAGDEGRAAGRGGRIMHVARRRPPWRGRGPGALGTAYCIAVLPT
jgi:hypothetical protein